MVLVLTVRSAADISPVGSVGAAALHRLQVFSYSSAPAVHLPLTRGRLTGRIGGGASLSGDNGTCFLVKIVIKGICTVLFYFQAER